MIKQINKYYNAFLLSSLTILVVLMGLFSFANIVLRWFEIGTNWIDPFVRHCVLASTFLGGAIATSKGQHIRIDFIERYLKIENKLKFLYYIKIFSSFIALLITLWLVSASYNFFKMEMEFGKFSFWNIHTGYLVLMIPVGLGLIAINFLLQILIYGQEGEQ